MIIHSVWRRDMASDSDASHWPNGIERTAPRTSSDMLASTGSDRPTVDLSQPGSEMMVWPTRTSNGSSSMQ